MQCRKTHFVKEKTLFKEDVFIHVEISLYLFGIEKSISKMYLINAANAHSQAMQ